MITLTPLFEEQIANIVNQTEDSLSNLQSHNVPHSHNLELVSSDEYVYDNERFTLSKEDSEHTKIFRSFNFPLLTNANHKHKFLYTLNRAVAESLVIPMIVTKNIKGTEYVIPWDDIIIVRDDVDVYLVIYGLNSDTVAEDIKCMIIPYPITYSTSIESKDKFPKIGFVFDNEGFAIYDSYRYSQAAIVIEINSNWILHKEFAFEEVTNGFVVDFGNKGRVSKDSIVVYKNNNIVTDNSKYIEYLGNNIFKLKDPDSALNLVVEAYYYERVDESVDNIYNLTKDGLNTYGNAILNGEELPEWYNKLAENLNLAANPPYEEAVQERFKKIYKYRKDLFFPNEGNTDINMNNVYVSHIKGSDILRTNDISTNTATMMTGRWKDEDSGLLQDFFYPIVFVNGKLYRKYNSIDIDKKSGLFTISTKKIKPDDDVEIYYVGESNSNVITATIPSSTKTITSSIDLTDCTIFEKDPTPINYPNITKNENACYEYTIDCTIEKTDVDTYSITFTDDKYYDKEVVIVSNKQFLTYSDISEGGENIFIELPEDFKYAQDPDRYMVFVGGKKINNEDLIFNFPKADNPFPFISIYSTILFEEGDMVDVIYMPYKVKTKIIEEYIQSDGIISVDDTFLPCGLNTENIMLFVNGNKISNNDIDIISDNIMQIKSDKLQSVKNLSIIIPDIEPSLPEELYRTDKWNELINSLSREELSVIFERALIEDTEEDMNDNKVQRNAVLLEIFRDYYADLYEGEPFAYDGTDEILDENNKDADMNYILNVANARVKNSVDFDKLGQYDK